MTSLAEFNLPTSIDASFESPKNYAFSLEYAPHITDQEIEDDVVSYLAEYRLKIPEYTYGLTFSQQDGVWGLRDSYRGESMLSKTQKALDLRRQNFQSTTREEAEHDAFTKLDTALRFAKEGDTLIWGSPPGRTEEGYGDYGFVYHGKVSVEGSGEKKLAMTAVRVDHAKISEYNSFFSEITGTDQNLEAAEDFIANPIIAGKRYDNFEMGSLLKENFKGIKDTDQGDIQEILYQLRPAIKDLIGYVRFGSQDIKRKALYTIENIALELKQRLENGIITMPRKIQLEDSLMDQYGHEPPIERGSCGSTGDFLSNDIFGMKLKDDEHGGRAFECPTCHLTNIRPEGVLLRNCQHCGSDKVAC